MVLRTHFVMVLRTHSDRPSFVRAFSGTDRHIVDYLVDEVLSRQSSEIQEFLLQTSILERLSGPLCDAVMGKGSGDSQSILEYLEQVNLFIVPLDNQRVWYRYHRLFAEVLRVKLRRVFPELIMTLRVRAADWCEKHGFIAEAVNQALAAKDWERVADWVEQNARDLLAHGQISTVMSWTAALPKETVGGTPWVRPRLCIELAWALAYANRLEEVEHWLRNTEIALEAGRDRWEDGAAHPLREAATGAQGSRDEADSGQCRPPASLSDARERRSISRPRTGASGARAASGRGSPIFWLHPRVCHLVLAVWLRVPHPKRSGPRH